ncbi:MAG: hypothetical protein J6S20_01200 [Paludibacteraceae bacterium]|jgi:hypothetical protein|nr:hypothetical protein [Paludibacteraceae bacterium]
MTIVRAHKLELVNIKYAEIKSKTALIANILFKRFVLTSDDGTVVKKRKIITRATPMENT